MMKFDKALMICSKARLGWCFQDSEHIAEVFADRFSAKILDEATKKIDDLGKVSNYYENVLEILFEYGFLIPTKVEEKKPRAINFEDPISEEPL